LATAGVVADGGTAAAAEDIWIMPALPPKAPAGAATGDAAEGLTVATGGRLSVLSELARPGSGASVEAEVPVEPSETGAPTIGSVVGLAEPVVVWRDGRAASDITDWLVVWRDGRAASDVADWLSPGWVAPP
jgi:hypothetical protein